MDHEKIGIEIAAATDAGLKLYGILSKQESGFHGQDPKINSFINEWFLYPIRAIRLAGSMVCIVSSLIHQKAIAAWPAPHGLRS